MARWNLAYDLYEKRLRRELPPEAIPRHVGVILDGNRRWAKSLGVRPSQGHRAGADKISEFLTWADEVGVEIVTLWMLSTDNLSRTSDELDELLAIIADAVDRLAAQGKWRLAVVGDLGLLPEPIAARILASVESTAALEAMRVNIAVGYGGRQEIADAVRELLRERAAAGASLEEVAASLSEEDITEHLYTKGQPDPDLVIRTSGEQRLSGFLLWQSVHSEYYFCEVNWPAFRRVDFLRALRDFASRERRLGR